MDEEQYPNGESALTKEEKHDGNWYEMRLTGRFPDRRAYHSGFLIEDK